MAVTGSPARTPLGRRSPAHLSKRHFERSSLYLITNTVLSGGLGTLFWLVAGRLYPAAEVGPAVAATSLLLALAFAAQLNLPTALSRYLPSAAGRQRPMVVFCYRVSVIVGCIFGLVLVVLALLGDHVVSGSDTRLTVILAVFIPIWTIFAMQDSVMIAARSSAIVPLENAATTVVKFGLLPLGIGLSDGSGILLSWTIPVLVAIPLVNYVIFNRILLPADEMPGPGMLAAEIPAAEMPVISRPRFVGYALRDFPGAILYLFSLRLVPLLIVAIDGKQAGAYIGLPWTILIVAALALPTLSASLLAELSHDDSDNDVLLSRANRLVFLLVLPGAVLGAVLAHPVMAVAGGHYARHGAPVLAWGILGLVPAALVELQLAVLRYRGRVITSSTLQSGRALTLVAGVVLLLHLGNASAIGIVLLVVNSLCAGIGWLLTRGRG